MKDRDADQHKDEGRGELDEPRESPPVQVTSELDAVLIGMRNIVLRRPQDNYSLTVIDTNAIDKTTRADIRRRIEECEAKIEDYPDANERKAELANLLLQAGDHSQAMPYLEQLLDDDSYNLAAAYNIGYCYMKDGEYAEAARKFQEIIDEDDQDEGLYRAFRAFVKKHAYNNLGVCHYHSVLDESQRVEKAAAEFHRAEEFGVDNAILMLMKHFRLDSDPRTAETSEIAGMIGNSEVMRKLRQKVQKAAASDFTVLIVGETGTGKELAGRAIHTSGRGRNKEIEKLFISINCAEFDPDTLEVELFGSVKGAFTGAINHGVEANRLEILPNTASLNYNHVNP